MREFGRRFSEIMRPSAGERIRRAKTDTQLLKVFRKDGLVRHAEDYEAGVAPKDVFTQEDLDAFVDKLSGIINQGQASFNLAQLIDKRIKRSSKIKLDLESAISSAKNYPGQGNYQEAFNNSILPVMVRVIEKVDKPHGFPFLVRMVENDFHCPGKMVNRVAYWRLETVKEPIQKGWDLSEEELVTYHVDIEDIIYQRQYPFAQAAAASLTKIRQQNVLGGGFISAIDEAIDKFHRKERQTDIYQREISRTSLWTP